MGLFSFSLYPYWALVICVFKEFSYFSKVAELIFEIVVQEFPGGLVVKDLALSLLWLRFDPWPRNFCMLQAQSEKTKQNKELFNIFPISYSIHRIYSYVNLGLLPFFPVRPGWQFTRFDLKVQLSLSLIFSIAFLFFISLILHSMYHFFYSF